MSRLTWNEIKLNAHKFVGEWKDASYEKGETQSFYNDFFQIFGVPRRRVATYEEPVKLLKEKRGFIDLIWKGMFLVEQKSAGRNLANAKQQALDYFPGIADQDLPRYVMACDFQNFELYDLETGEEAKFTLQELPDHVDKFGFIMGVEKRSFRDQDPVNIKASVLMGKLHDALLSSGYTGHDLERFLVRLLFCLFADDTGIFEPRDIFDDVIRNTTKDDGSDLGITIAQIFQTLNEHPDQRQKSLKPDIAQFPYINGDLFAESLRLPSFDAKMRGLLLEACDFNWSKISPAIFGALMQHISGDANARRQGGEHYTSENHILRVIDPLFLDELESELETIKKKAGTAKNKALDAYVEKLSQLTFFDPACGCGNFLVVTYREIRRLELEALQELYKDSSGAFGAALGSRVTVHQFYGIEIEEYSVRIAEVALWMMDHITNIELSIALNTDFRRIPIQDKPNVHHADALDMDWNTVLPAKECSYVFGNPPFLGAKIQSESQRGQVRRIANLGKSGGTLDYVCAWYLKTGAYVQGTKARIAFVSTNSITQGEQVAQLWPLLFHTYGLEISFAHRTFEWSSDAKGKAHVHVVIIGLTLASDEPKVKRLFSYSDIRALPTESQHAKLSPYLIDASRLADPYVTISEAGKPINGLPKAIIGSKPIDDGHLILDKYEAARLSAKYIKLAQYIRPLLGSDEFINNESRFILALQQCPPNEVKSWPEVVERLRAVAKFRAESKSPGTQALALTPTLFHVNVLPESSFLVLPQTSSETRDYMPIGFVSPPFVPTNAVKVVLGATHLHFSILTSRMHMAWMKAVTGRLKSDYQYSIGIVYNNFPWPEVSDAQKAQVEKLGQAVLDARANHPTSTLADLYDPITMPPDLRKAHQALDQAVDKAYKPNGFANDLERVEHLLGLYEKLKGGLFVTEKKPKRKKKEG
jgi:hypothetical protein